MNNEKLEVWTVIIPIQGEAEFHVRLPKGATAQDAYNAATKGKNPATSQSYKPIISWSYEEDERMGLVATATDSDGVEREVGAAWDPDEEEAVAIEEALKSMKSRKRGA